MTMNRIYQISSFPISDLHLVLIDTLFRGCQLLEPNNFTCGQEDYIYAARDPG